MWDIRAMVTAGNCMIMTQTLYPGPYEQRWWEDCKTIVPDQMEGMDIYIYIKYWSLRGFVSKLDIYNLQTLLFLQHPERILMLEIQSTYKMLR